MPSISLNQIAGAINQSIGVPTSATSFVDGVNQTISSIGLSQISNGAQTIAGGIAIASALGILAPEIVITSTVVAAAITGYKALQDVLHSDPRECYELRDGKEVWRA